MIGEGAVLFGVQHFEQRRRRVTAPVGTEFVDFVEQEQRVGGFRLLHPLHHFTGHGADIGAAVAAHFRFVPHPAQRHTDEVAAGGTRDRLAERGFADARRADEAKDRPLHLIGARLHGEVFKDAFLDLLQAEMVGVEDFLRLVDVFLDLAALLPGDRQNPVQVVAHHGRFGAHRAHRPELLQLRHRLFPGFLRQLGFGDPLLDLRGFVLAVLAFAEFLLNGLHLLVQIVLALGLLHLALDAVADLFLDLHDADFGVHVAEDFLQPLGNLRDFQQFLAFGDLDVQMRGNGVGELARFFDLVDRDQHLRRDLFVQLDILLELADHRAAQRFQLLGDAGGFRDALDMRLEKRLGFLEVGDAGAAAAFDQHFDGAIGQFQQLQHGRDGADGVDVVDRRVVLLVVFLRHQQDLLIFLHHRFERADGFFPADEQRHDHVREDDDVAQRQDRQHFARCRVRLTGCSHICDLLMDSRHTNRPDHGHDPHPVDATHGPGHSPQETMTPG